MHPIYDPIFGLYACQVLFRSRTLSSSPGRCQQDPVTARCAAVTPIFCQDGRPCFFTHDTKDFLPFNLPLFCLHLAPPLSVFFCVKLVLDPLAKEITRGGGMMSGILLSRLSALKPVKTRNKNGISVFFGPVIQLRLALLVQQAGECSNNYGIQILSRNVFSGEKDGR